VPHDLEGRLSWTQQHPQLKGSAASDEPISIAEKARTGREHKSQEGNGTGRAMALVEGAGDVGE